jgi:CubicO group peptidase (beta-lactamase class C family)
MQTYHFNDKGVVTLSGLPITKSRFSMLRLIRFTAIALLLFTISFTYVMAQAPRATTEAEIYAKLSDLIQTKMSQSKVPGVAVAIVRGNQTTFAKGFGFRDVANNLPATADTLFHIGSTHKSMTVMMIGTVVDEGKLTWDTKAVSIYPQFKLSNDQSTQNVTMRHLLNMTSGIPASAEDDFDLSLQPEDLFSYMATQDLAGQPGQVYDYSNISYALAGYLGVLAHDKNTLGQLMAGYQELFKAKIIVPIGMTNAVIKVSEAQANPNYGKAYRVQNGQVTEAVLEDDDNDTWAPAGSLKASVTDMARYISTQLNNGVAPNGNRIVSEATLIESRKPYLEDYALGWEVLTTNGVTHYIHEGDVDDYLSVVGFVPSLNMGYVVFTNSTDAGGAVIEAVPPFLVSEFSALPAATATPVVTGSIKVYLPVILK